MMVKSYISNLLVFLTSVCLPVAATAAGGRLVSNPANLKGEYFTNPIVFSDYSDPDVTASPDGKTFYMTASSFQCAPGLPILRSTDLVNWELVNYAIKAVPPAEVYSTVKHGKGVWAPSIRCHNGEYYIYWGDPDVGVFMVKTADPEGEWSEPVLVVPGKGIIDTTPLWDDDGRLYMVNGWAASRCGFNSLITVRELSPDGTRAISDPVVVFDGNDGVNHTVEGPKLYKRDGWYWIFAPAGGVVDGWQLVMRSRNIYGPYEPRIVMAQGSTDINGPHQGAWVDGPDGRGWFLHFQDRGAYGRILHLNPLQWRADGWPVIGSDPDGDGCGEPVKRFSRPAPADASLSYDELQSPALYEWHSNYAADRYGFALPQGMMRIYSGRIGKPANLWSLSNLWLQKFPAEKFTLTARVRISAKESSEEVSSGLVVMGWDYSTLALCKRGEVFELQRGVCADAEKGSPESVETLATITPTRIYPAGLLRNLEADIWLRVEVGEGALCNFSYSLDGRKFHRAGAPFKARAGKWIGAKVGFFSLAPEGVADLGWIDVLEVKIKK